MKKYVMIVFIVINKLLVPHDKFVIEKFAIPFAML